MSHRLTRRTRPSFASLEEPMTPLSPNIEIVRSGRVAPPTAVPGLAAIGAALATAIAGCSRPAAAERVAPPVEVVVVEAKSMTVPVIAEPIGTSRALQEVSIRARVRGFLKEIHFK